MMEYFSQNGYYGYYKDEKFVSIGYDILVTQAWRHLESGKLTFEVEFCVGTDIITVKTSYATFRDDVEAAGFAVPDNVKHHYKAYLRQQIDNLSTVEYLHEELGWEKGDGKPVFKGYKLKGSNKTSTYDGDYDISPRGDRTDFIAEMRRVILPNIKLVLGMILGLSACVVGFLKANAVNIDTIICSIVGRSTTGKSTVAKLAASMGGSVVGVKKGKRSLFGNCSATENAIEERCNGNYGEPVVFDEIGRFKKQTDFSQLLYDLAEGTNKDRLDSNSKLRKPKTWSTTVIFTGEFSILSKVDKTDGLSLRLLSFEYDQWTNSPEESHEVEKFFAQYNGRGIDMFAEEILRHKPDVIIRAFWRIVRITQSKLSVAPEYCERIAKSIAVMLLTALLAQRVFRFKLGIKTLAELILSSISNSQQRPMWQTAYEHFCAFVKRNPGIFNFKIKDSRGILQWSSSDHVPFYKDAGYVAREGGGTDIDEVFIVTPKFDEWAKNEELPDKNPILQEWERNGLMKFKDSKHKEMTRSISHEKNNRRHGYRIFIKDIFADENDDEPEEIKPLSKAEIDEMLSDDE